MLTLSTQAKEATKTATAMVLVYGIAMRMGWPNPYWAAFAVAMISLPTAGQSLLKGALRMGGTLLGCFAGVTILALAPQDRWDFMLLASGWVFLMTYQMIGSRHAYFWHVSGFVCLIITLSGTSASVNPFLDAMARTVDTAMGILVYTLITAFVWPRTNIGAVKQASLDILATQARLLRICGARLTGAHAPEDGPDLRMQQVKQLGQLNQALQAEGSERFEVHELRHQWAHLQKLSAAMMTAIDRWFVSIAELNRVDVFGVLPDIDAYCAELDRRLAQVRRTLAGDAPGTSPQPVTLAVDAAARKQLSHFDRAALAVTRQEIEKIEVLTRSLLECAGALTGAAKGGGRPGVSTPARARRGRFNWPVPDPDRIWGATFAATTTATGFLIWILFNPPGHASMYQLAGTIAMAVAARPQIKATVFLKPFAVAMLLGLAVYVFVLPRLSGYAELAVPIFLFTFVTCYFFTGVGRLAGLVAMINMVSIQNEQTYNFAAMANSYLFTLMAFALVFVVSYMLGSPRPEKVFRKLLSRFLGSAAALIGQPSTRSEDTAATWTSWRTAFHHHELQSLPGKLTAWGSSVDRKKFSGNPPEPVQKLVTRVQALAYRIEAMFEAEQVPRSEQLARPMAKEIQAWRAGIEEVCRNGSRDIETTVAGDLRDRLTNEITALEARLQATLDRSGADQYNEQDSESFYRLLGSYRGASEGIVAFAGQASEIDWALWREERF